jgi:hypothetical protein
MKRIGEIVGRSGAAALWDAAAFSGLALAIAAGFSAGALF